MVSVKNIVIAASLLLNGVVAAPVLDREQGAAAVDIRAIDKIPVQSRNLNEAPVAAFGVSKAKDQKAKTPAPKPKTPAPKPKTPAPKPKTPAPKPKTPQPQPKPKPKPTTPQPTKPKTCKLKKPRSLERREGPLKPAKSAKDINEDMYVLSATGEVVVTNLSGCTALFLWDDKDRPSVFHIFCGDETAKAWEAIDKVGRAAKAYSIVASKESRYKNTKKEIVNYAENEGWPALKEDIQGLYDLDATSKTVLKLIAKAGSRTITPIRYPNPNCQ
ncbi:hypothetical protein C7974DRAFT_417577 [Boeremia exigua]|uniref:uncharacterized protein n=1 Tax=Boeremia exigua TaxID=749465 RepID=UPI001E8D6B8D|nr:uncharacterized protein C7974DRAFT_417577 [Boeremia exigua]KAH6613823.1 hypothetical protein C7974DRAFT_417577 [Boeremia exigua]